jgi:AMMECR1 domain-containing protein
MINAVAKLISHMHLEERQSVRWFLTLLIFVAYVLPAPSALGQEAASCDPSFARIVIGHADYARAAQSHHLKDHDFVSLPEIARQTMFRYFGKLNPAGRATETTGKQANENGLQWVNLLKVEPRFLQPAGVFVTLSKRGKTRACWGSIYPREATIERETAISTLGALSRDYRFRPVSASELNDLKIQVTVIRGLEAVTDIKSINPFKEGVMVRSGGRGGVILPGEAVDAYYEFVLARLKAGIKPDEPCQIYKIRTEIYD